MGETSQGFSAAGYVYKFICAVLMCTLCMYVCVLHSGSEIKETDEKTWGDNSLMKGR